MTTFSAFVRDVQALAVPGVRRTFDAPPASISTADMPAMWVNTAGVDEAPAAARGIGWPTLRAELYLVVKPVTAGSSTFLDAVDFAEALREALRGADVALGSNKVSVRVAILTLGDKCYWAVIGTVEAQG